MTEDVGGGQAVEAGADHDRVRRVGAGGGGHGEGAAAATAAVEDRRHVASGTAGPPSERVATAGQRGAGGEAWATEYLREGC